MNNLLFALLGVSLLSGCASAVGRHHLLTLPVVRSFDVGKTTKSDLMEKLGPPGFVHVTELEEFFLYYKSDDPYRVRPRASFVFQKNGDVLQNVVWSVERGDSEYELGRAKALFSTESYREEAISHPSDGHFIASEKLAVSVDGRVRILFFSRSGEVQSVNWGLPQPVRAVATRKE